MIQTYNQHVVKQRNKSLILNSIKNSYPISRAALANQTGLNKGTVSSLVSELLEEELILESGPGISSGGRRPVMLLFNQAAGYSIGIDIGVNYVLAILTDLQGKICYEKQIEIHELTFSETTEVLFNVIDDLFAAVPKSPYGIVGIGIGVPGTVSKDGEILLAPNLNWKNINLKSVIEQKYNLPVTIHNEANAGAYGEKKFGAGQEFTNLIYISGGIGIGVGLILNNQLYLGQNGLSGELGHMTINTDGPPCNCGSKGCWELFASEKALLQSARNEGITTPDNSHLSLESLIALAESGDAKTIELIHKLGRNLAIGLNNIINIFNPEQIIIGNRLASLQKWLSEELKIQLEQSSLTNHQANLNLQFSELEKRSAALGVAAFSTENFIKINLGSN
ncbi:xylose repressor [Alkalihalobacillus alcalophilus ATCC 27647 = CGMCC 1.3604]|uniref:ROK family protein n=1 Tax=Alkalihalobacillus alcalophilus ATCC 27647 = CGMCC 1.3604 TaxID=1218173 RepID=A0A094WNH4_ALKAL|nr:ROK family protein [Alkalihalobacillus alcalophilus]KGA97523.1 ROK family protein [Alkalihalobacillus alcalophilus ATCC 27647 = CGMCC 1.3604]MED1560776.1 ROK family protein [Alkalihalobacillus alcalophilus]THG92436.1 xylose repressor [Alkalihalobacillus alcalophilus ATCC 27647 = CGMCC 1.3604]